jgi:hypothetical protein
MANYKELEGFGVQTLATDPDSAGWVGSIFYNSTSGTFKVVKPGGVTAGTWASGTSINTARGYSAGVGDASNALVFGGRSSPTGFYAINESYNGSSWTEVGDLNTGRRNLESAGTTNTAALGFGGYVPPGSVTAINESWNGTSWTEVNDLNTARSSLAGGGTTTSALAINGDPSPAYLAVESWDGTSWTEIAETNSGTTQAAASVGSNTDGLRFSGYQNPGASITGITEKWNGSTWTELADLNTARSEDAGSAGRSSTSALIFGGYVSTPVVSAIANTESWDGTSWTEVNDLSTAVYGPASGPTGTNANAINIGGNAPPYVANVEEWTAPDVVINTLTTS